MQIQTVTAAAVLLFTIVVGVVAGFIASARCRKPAAPEPAEEDAFPNTLRLWAFYASARMAALKLGAAFNMVTINGTTLKAVAINAAQAIGQQEGAEVADGTHREILTISELEAAVRSLLGMPATKESSGAAPKVEENVHGEDKDLALRIRDQITPGDLVAALDKDGWWPVLQADRGRTAVNLPWRRHGDASSRSFDAAIVELYKNGKLTALREVST